MDHSFPAPLVYLLSHTLTERERGFSSRSIGKEGEFSPLADSQRRGGINGLLNYMLLLLQFCLHNWTHYVSEIAMELVSNWLDHLRPCKLVMAKKEGSMHICNCMNPISMSWVLRIAAYSKLAAFLTGGHLAALQGSWGNPSPLSSFTGEAKYLLLAAS